MEIIKQIAIYNKILIISFFFFFHHGVQKGVQNKVQKGTGE
jgi:hypothetical protein